MSIKHLCYKFLTVVCLGIALFSLFKLSRIYMDDMKNKQTIAEAQEYYLNKSVVHEEDGRVRSEKEVRPRFNSLLEMNADVVGWLEMDHTSINYPIVQAEDNEYYLSRNIKREEVNMGSIFMDYRNDISTNFQHTILYGHRMKNGSMFGQLNRYLDEEFFQENQSFHYDTLYESFEAEIFSVYVTTTDFDYIQTDFANEEEYVSFLQMIQDKSRFPTNTMVTASDHILTLSTCDYTLDNETGRLVIHAKIKKKVDSM
ncbi:class B sortase [Peribacillus loiseleuriae]|uniref:Sortase n=1 Tax=Peribacillus loiseleuriae TaxID=1679170 RepID=A0A0K9GYY4_9BACI|nr:class B sortase [Peribacillus loiseleuriae]KMY51462.1 sortase [Peribacillus loiseleuriae]